MNVKSLKQMERERALHRSFVDRLNIANKKSPQEVMSKLPFSKRKITYPFYYLLRGLNVWLYGYWGFLRSTVLLAGSAIGFYWLAPSGLIIFPGVLFGFFILSLLFSAKKENQLNELIIGARLLDKWLGDKRYETWLEMAEYVKEDRAYRYVYSQQWLTPEQVFTWAEESNTEVLYADMMEVTVKEKYSETVSIPRQEKNSQGQTREWIEQKQVQKFRLVPAKKYVILLRNIASWKSDEELNQRIAEKEKNKQDEQRLQGFIKYFEHQFRGMTPGLHHEFEDEWEKTYVFFHDGGLTIDDWKKNKGKDRLSSYLGKEVVDIRLSKKYRRHIEVVVAKQELPDELEFDPSMVPEEDRLFWVGMSHKPILIDVDKVPHAIIAATTGGGKSVCMNNLVTQATMRGSLVYFADYKGVETSLVKTKGYRVVNRAPELETLLSDILRESERRGRLFEEYEARNIRDYRKKSGAILPRIFLFIDEAAQFLAEKGQHEVEALLLRTSQEVRFAGIHIILCTQRPSADVLSTDIRSCLAGRIAGYMDNVSSSQMVLGNNLAHSALSGKLNTGRMIIGGAYGLDLEIQTPFVDLAVMKEFIPQYAYQPL
ncbi:FtsK/SpoIIIE domain-containing protein [Brevibacillus sp. SYSU BS000544]|uniref:FtsK/SpoIIIE domain-containing protein n=1 Tax=Brevibacillus sp. SYSU BS000544 TaxID=3416443 RepID=UPI003CE4AAE0